MTRYSDMQADLPPSHVRAMASLAGAFGGGGKIKRRGGPSGPPYNEVIMKTAAPGPSASKERRGSCTTISGRPIHQLYTPADIAALDYERDLGDPGAFPYTRGIHPTGYRGKLWTMRQFAGFGTPEETNKRYKQLLKAGGTGLSVAFDLPTLMGRDPDHELSLGEVGKCGVNVTSLADMETLFEGIDLAGITTSMTINSPASMIFAMYLVVAEQQGASWESLSGTIQNDILKEFIAQKEYIYPPRPSMRLITDVFAFCAERVPRWNTISVSGYHIREAGAMAAVLGGTQSLHTNSLDEALALPTEEAATLALRTQQIIAHETGVTNIVDPLGGSYFVEKLTSDLEEETLAYFDTIDRMGGMVAAIEEGYPQREVAESAYRFQQAVEQRDKIIVGVNDFVAAEDEPIGTLYIDESAAGRQLAKLNELRKSRDNGRVRAALDALKEGARGSANTMPLLVDAGRADAIGLSILSGAHMHICPRVMELLREKGLQDVLVVVGGIIPDVDIPKLNEIGIKGIFLPGTPMQEIVDFLTRNVRSRVET